MFSKKSLNIRFTDSIILDVFKKFDGFFLSNFNPLLYYKFHHVLSLVLKFNGMGFIFFSKRYNALFYKKPRFYKLQKIIKII